MIFLVLIIGILSIGAVSASDLNNAYTSDNGSQLLDNSNTVDINSSNNVGADSQVLVLLKVIGILQYPHQIILRLKLQILYK